LWHIQWLYLLWCFTHQMSAVSQKKTNCSTGGVSTAMRKAKFEYHLAINQLICCDVFIFCYPDYQLDVVTASGMSCNRPTVLTSVGFLGFPLSSGKCWDDSQGSNLPLHASHYLFPFKFTELITISVMVTKFFFLINHEIIISSESTLIRHQIFERKSMKILTRSSLKVPTALLPQNTLFIIFSVPFKNFKLLRQKHAIGATKCKAA
jgi:hypothetical protein